MNHKVFVAALFSGLASACATAFVACGSDGSDAPKTIDASASDGAPDAAPGSDAASTADDAATDAATVALDLRLSRLDGGIGVTVHVTSGALGEAPTLSVTGGEASALVPSGAPGDYTATVTPLALDTEVPISVSAHGVTVSKIALAVANIDDALDQPEVVPGLVNTTGIEDGANVSPDGQWLIVASYVPVDIYSCTSAGLVMTAPACSTIIGPASAPERPNMLGASRIHGSTYTSGCPSLGLAAPQAHSFFPAAAYVFHRQPDGSFAEPHVLGADADGCLGPYGYSFTEAPDGGVGHVVFAEDDPFDSPDTKADIYFLSLMLGQDNVWGTYTVSDAGVSSLSGMKATRLPPVLPSRQGNPAFTQGVLAWDNEDLPEAARVLYFTSETGTLPNVTNADAGAFWDAGAAELGTSNADQGQIQPAFDAPDVYWFGSGGIYRATWDGKGDLTAAASFTTRTRMLAPGAASGIVAIGEPTVAHVTGGAKELYFVYIKKVGAGLDGAVGRVPFR